MGVTTGALQPGEYQIITITIPSAPGDDDVGKLIKDLQDLIDAFNTNNNPKSLEVL